MKQWRRKHLRLLFFRLHAHAPTIWVAMPKHLVILDAETAPRTHSTASSMKKIICIAAFIFSSIAFANTPSSREPVSSIIVMPWDINQDANLLKNIKKNGFSHVTFYLNWSDIENQKNQYQFSHYYKYLDAIVNSGLSLIMVLDMGGRSYLDENGKKIPDASTVPAWVYKDHPDSVMKNFSGEYQWQLDFTDDFIQKKSTEFTEKTVLHFSNRYPGKILGFSVGLQEEHEIKYGQTGYQWRDYKKSTQNDFSKKYGTPQPVINYNNNIHLGPQKIEPLLYIHKEYRENRLRDATCLYSKAIRKNGALAMGYFAETFTSHDAIYATGVVEKLADCIDIAVIDFNFYDGYKLVPDTDVLPTLANYMGSLGYKQIMVGAYAEVWERQKKTHELIPVINRTITQALSQSNVIGFEVGGFQRQATAGQSATIDTEKLSAIAIKPANDSPKLEKRRAKIGILGSATNFYVWHGERSAGRNTHRDALFAAYKILNSQPELDVHLIGEKNLLQDDPIIQSLDAILVPHQTALPQSIKSKLATYWKNGGALVQDMRLGEFDENGKPTADWMNDVFGISKIKWKNKGGVFLINGEVLRLKPSRSLYTSYASITPRQGYKLLATDILQPENGIMVRGERTLVFGFMPQLIEDPTKDAWRKIFVQEIMNVVPQRANSVQVK
ncbi:beta-galactosidase [Acidovorax sp. FJL06]|uniref:beta-galactosidase n=1 Tax=Acidovorax sp. FJL06 TaxID=2153365 RepID=UPI001F31EA59|nr:beta-galactosidase [Acidovorax sp. FJL06]